MAETEQVSGRREDPKKNCAPCSDEGTIKTATKYCFMCETSFCQDCTKQHNKLLSKHRVTEIESATVGVSLTVQTEPCPQHGKALKQYCYTHDSVCCDECIDREHLSCKDIVYLPTSAQDVIKNIDVTEIKSKLRRTIEQLESIKINQVATVSSLEQDRDNCLKEINDHHTELLDLLEKIVQSSKDQVKHTFEEFSAVLQRHRQEVEKGLDDLESSEKRLERYEGNDFRLFLELKKSQNQLKATEEASRDSLTNLKTKGFSVAVDDRVHILLSELESLVTVLKKASVQVKKKYKVGVSCKEENESCWIYGSCVLHDGSILLTDCNNKILKCIDHQSLKVTDQLLMQHNPFDVCVINNNEVAITQTNNTVAIVSVRHRLTLTATISMDHYCGYIAYSQGELFIVDHCSTQLYIYNMEGSLLRKVSTDQYGRNIFGAPRHIMISTSAVKVYIVDMDRGVITIGREGRVIDKLTSDKIRDPFGLCLDGMGGLFVCGFYSNNVVHVGADGQILNEVLTTTDGLVKPLSLCYDKLRKRLIVTQGNSDQVHVCEFE